MLVQARGANPCERGLFLARFCAACMVQVIFAVLEFFFEIVCVTAFVDRPDPCPEYDQAGCRKDGQLAAIGDSDAKIGCEPCCNHGQTGNLVDSGYGVWRALKEPA